MKFLWSVYFTIKKLSSDFRREHIGAFAAQSAFFLIMSFLPLALLILSILQFSSVGMNKFYHFVKEAIPSVNSDSIVSLFSQLTVKPGAVISVTTLLTAWSAGKGFYALSEGFHSVLHIDEKRNYLFLRIRSLLFSVLFAIVIAVALLIGVFGDVISALLQNAYPDAASFTYLITGVRKLFIIAMLFLILTFLYTLVPDWNTLRNSGRQRQKIKYNLCGALLASAVIYLYSVLFSLYINKYSDFSGMYGSLSTLICVMLWLYGTMYILISGFKLSVFLSGGKKFPAF